MKILILNWRDIQNPTSGGAEILTHEIAKRWVLWGHEVTQFSSVYPGCLSEETVDGVKIIRRGQPYTRYIISSVHFLAFIYYQKNFRNKFDAVIDEVHGIPFFTPWYVKEKKILLICEVASSLWTKIFGNIFGTIGMVIEKIYLRFIYITTPYLTISESTKADLLKNGVKEEKITVLPMGITVPEKLTPSKKEKTPTLLFLGRLSPSKGVEDTIIVLSCIIKRAPTTILWIVGRSNADYEKRLKIMVKKLHLEKNIRFFGFVSEKEKFALMGRAHILVSPSSHEGFGLTIPEAGIVHTPSIAYNVSGLRDTIKNGENGILTSENTPKALADEILDLLSDKKKYSSLCKGAYMYARQYNWDKTAKIALEIIQKI